MLMKLLNKTTLILAGLCLFASAAPAIVNIPWGFSTGDIGNMDITPGTTVRWTWDDPGSHNVTFISQPDGGGAISSPTISSTGFEYEQTFTVAGVYSFQDSVVPSTQGSLTVVPEPSTYAALAGLGIFGLAVWQRKRRA